MHPLSRVSGWRPPPGGQGHCAGSALPLQYLPPVTTPVVLGVATRSHPVLPLYCTARASQFPGVTSFNCLWPPRPGRPRSSVPPLPLSLSKTVSSKRFPREPSHSSSSPALARNQPSKLWCAGSFFFFAALDLTPWPLTLCLDESPPIAYSRPSFIRPLELCCRTLVVRPLVCASHAPKILRLQATRVINALAHHNPQPSPAFEYLSHQRANNP